MAIIRIEKTKDYTVMSNYHFKEKDMSLKAKGLLSLMLSLPENWDYSVAGLVAICKENETSIKSALDELKEFGYLEVVKKMPNETKTGRIEYEYIVYEHKINKINTDNIEVKVGKELIQELEKQGIENLGVEFLGVENPIQYNNKQLNTNNKIDNNIYIEIINYLNEKAGTNYRASSKATQSHINARVKEKYTLDDFKTVIDKKVSSWKGTTMEQYLRPETLFGSKFEGYLNEKAIFKGVNNAKPKADGSMYANIR